MRGDFNPFDQMVAQQELGNAVLRRLPEASIAIRLEVNALAALLRLRASTESSDGSRQSLEIDDELDTGLIRRLRRSMYQEEAGTWFRASLAVSRAGEVAAADNYDEEPIWAFPVDPIAYVTDQEKFPRDEANQPD